MRQSHCVFAMAERHEPYELRGCKRPLFAFAQLHRAYRQGERARRRLQEWSAGGALAARAGNMKLAIERLILSCLLSCELLAGWTAHVAFLPCFGFRCRLWI